MSNTRPLLEWCQDVPKHERLQIHKYRDLGVVLVNDGVCRWAGDLASFEAAAEQPNDYSTLREDQEPASALAYGKLCSLTTLLSPTDSRVAAACERGGWDARALQS